MSQSRMFAAVALLMALCITAGCASKSKSAGPRVLAATTPEQVKIYQTAPKKYEPLAVLVLEIKPEYRWDHRGNANAAFDEMKRQAAALGANGLLLQAPPGQTTALALAGNYGEFYEVPMTTAKPRSAVAQAIYVPSKK